MQRLDGQADTRTLYTSSVQLDRLYMINVVAASQEKIHSLYCTRNKKNLQLAYIIEDASEQ